MAELNTADIEHVNIIDKEFRESLRKYNIKFEGRGKHIKKAQDDIISNLNLINKISRAERSRDEVQFNLMNIPELQIGRLIERTTILSIFKILLMVKMAK